MQLAYRQYARPALSNWRSDSNDHRLNSGLGWLTPAEFFAQTINPRRDVMRCCAAGMAPHRNPPLPPRIQQPKNVGANPTLDKIWGARSKVMEAGEIDTQQKQKMLLDGYAEELFEKRLEWANLQVSVRVLVREGWLWVWFICFVLDCCFGCGGLNTRRIVKFLWLLKGNEPIARKEVGS